MVDEIPQWAIERARVLGGNRVLAHNSWSTRDVLEEAGHSAWADITLAFARYIAEHEEPLVDPMITEAAGLIQNWRDGGAGEDDAHDTARLVLAALRRGMELAREQSK